MKPEILAPAGSMESVYAAVRCGADAVYLGGKSFSARQNAANFSDEELCEAVRYCHLHGVAVHQAINTLVLDGQLDEVRKTAVRSAEIGVDAFIIQDLGVLSVVREVLPDMPLHASTQMTVHTKEGALLAKNMGFSRVVVSRELSLEQIAEICTAPVEVEVFVHGALCMSVSGQCYMSAMIGSRSANRGLCAQACRLPFSADEKEHYALSLKDMSYVEELDRLEKAGVASLKIEGRMKRPEYVAAAVSAVREAVDGEKPDIDTLRAVFSRSGFTNGYLENNLGAQMFGTREKEDVVAAKSVLPAMEELFRRERAHYGVDFELSAKSGEPLMLSASVGEIKVSLSGEVPSQAQNKALDKEQLEKQLSKLGGTVFFFGGLEAEIDDGLYVPAAQLNDLRRQSVEALEKKIIEGNTHKHTIINSNIKKEYSFSANNSKPSLRLYVSSAKQLDGFDLSAVSAVILPLSEWKRVSPNEKIFLALPRFIVDEEGIREELSQAGDEGFTEIYCNNLSHIKLAYDLGFNIHGGYGLNIANSAAAEELKRLGVLDYEASFELKLSQLSHLPGKFGIVAYGRLPLMLTRNCPIKSQVGCEKCKKKLTDRTGREFPVSCSKDYAEILNSDVLYMADRLDEIRNADFLTLMFDKEKAAEIAAVVGEYKKGGKAPEKFTRGLYYRGVL